jgi:hypothetical protein
MSNHASTWQRLVDAAVERLSATRRTFTDQEALAEVWEAGYEIALQDDPRFALAQETDGKHPRHWRLRTHALANNRLLDELRAGTWDGCDLDQELVRLDARDGVHYVFCPIDSRFLTRKDGSLALADQEPEVALPPKVQGNLDTHAQALLARWRDAGAPPWTTGQISQCLADLGWVSASERGSWLLVRAWLKSWSAVARVGQDYWLIADLLPQGPTRTRLQVLPIRPAGGFPAIEEKEQTPQQREQLATAQVAPTPVDTSFLAAEQKTGLLAGWVETLRTANLTQGFLHVPASARSAYPARAPGSGEWEALRGKWFETNEDLWLWLDRAHDLLCGPDLADKLAWCDAGQKLRVDWLTDGIVLHAAGMDTEVQLEEMRLVDGEALAALRGGLGESYRRSLLAIFAEASQGLSFKEIVEALRARQNHTVHRGTIRALLAAGGFVQQEGRWFVALGAEAGARQLRAALAQTLIAPVVPEQAFMPPNDPQRLRTLAHAIQVRLQDMIGSQQQASPK